MTVESGPWQGHVEALQRAGRALPPQVSPPPARHPTLCHRRIHPTSLAAKQPIPSFATSDISLTSRCDPVQAPGAPEIIFLPMDAPVWAFAAPVGARPCMVVTGATIAQARRSRSVDTSLHPASTDTARSTQSDLLPLLLPSVSAPTPLVQVTGSFAGAKASANASQSRSAGSRRTASGQRAHGCRSQQ